MDFLLEVNNLSKQYGDLMAVDSISFGIPKGVCFGLLGPNGAGKTTTIEMIEGITEPSGGDILYQGKAKDHIFSKQSGIQFQSTALQDFLTVNEVLDLFSSFYDNPLPKNQLIDLCELAEFTGRPANKLSGGQKQRLLLALALINDPVIVFLDEPTTGLDPQSRRKFWDLVTLIKSKGKTIVLTTHYMDEAELLCDELVIMDHGKIIAQGSPRELLNKHMPHKMVCADGENEIETLSVEETLNELIANGTDLSNLRVRNPTLEDLFIHMTGHQLRE